MPITSFPVAASGTVHAADGGSKHGDAPPPAILMNGIAESPAGRAPRRILIVDDHPVVRIGIRALIDTEDDLVVCGEAGTAPEALNAMRHLKPDAALLDVSMPGTNGIELVKLMKSEQERLAILVLSMHDESLYALRALRAGALGYVMKAHAMGHLLDAIHQVLRGNIYVSPELARQLIFRVVNSVEAGQGSPVDDLSEREVEVLEHLGRGLGTRDIARELNLSVKTIETHRSHIKQKLNIKDAAGLVQFAHAWIQYKE